MVRAKSAGLICSFLFQPLPSTLGRLPALWQCHQAGLDQSEVLVGKQGVGVFPALQLWEHYCDSCKDMPDRYSHIWQGLLTLVHHCLQLFLFQLLWKRIAFDCSGWPPHLLVDFPVASAACVPVSWSNPPNQKDLQWSPFPCWSLSNVGGSEVRVTVYLGGDAPPSSLQMVLDPAMLLHLPPECCTLPTHT